MRYSMMAGALLFCGICLAGDKPNLIVINVDDLGWNDVSYLPETKSPYYTPNIAKLAQDGMVFTDGYCIDIDENPFDELKIALRVQQCVCRRPLVSSRGRSAQLLPLHHIKS